VVAIVAVVVLVGLCGAMLMIVTRSTDERGATVDRHQALSAAHAGIGHAMVALTADDDVRTIGTPDEPVAFGGGTYWATITPDGASGDYTVASFATVRGETEAIEALVSGGTLDIYDHALFAGNTSGDPRYMMKLGGRGDQADRVNGDVYSGGGVAITGTALVNGSIRAEGAILGGEGEMGVSQPVPDIAAMNYPARPTSRSRRCSLRPPTSRTTRAAAPGSCPRPTRPTSSARTRAIAPATTRRRARTTTTWKTRTSP
jgi:hypothetical protein